jgi:hypothetical protein
MNRDLKNFWVSWYDKNYGQWELHWPWWVSGCRLSDDARTICAAVRAESADHAMIIIENAHDEPRPLPLEWRFVSTRAPDWSPFSDRFPRADWMKWPEEGTADAD